MTESEKRILRALLRVWAQWGTDVVHDDDGCVLKISHQCMGAGEDAVDLLQDYGLAEDDGYYAVLTEAGKTLMEEDD